MKWKTFFMVLVLVLFCSGQFLFSFTPVSEMTTEAILSELIQLYNERLSDLSERETDLTERSRLLELRETAYQENVTDLMIREADLKERESFYTNLINELEQKAKTEYKRGLLHGSIGGVIMGGISGGVTVWKLSE